jgi:3'-phosphoadenosine 5'-phosphosulfate sulfotransferase (PAPS reductase)/FAD synthetase
VTPFILPDSNVQIAFSGGRTSAFMLHQILEANGPLPDRVKVITTNTGREMPAWLEFVSEISSRWQVDITMLEYAPDEPGYHVVGFQGAAMNGEPFAALIGKVGFVPTVRTRGGVMMCSTRLKTRPASKYLRAIGWSRWTVALGIRADEATRSASPGREFWKNWRPLVDAGATKQDVSAFWARQPFDLKAQNVNGVTPHGNCDLCPLKSEATLAAMIRDMPDRAAWWEAQEARLEGTTKTAQGARFNKNFKIRELKHFVGAQADWIFSTEGALCQADDGECFG